ncbi:NYN domain-containing protein [Arthrobacter sp. JSM 101049]|uniref:NYN domain-containing protein n=1 Tax=Arthrobacter sp. JSM 101049 TaxID=929097 RepID=UPI00356875DF
MTTQSAIFVDAGFLLAVGGQHTAGTSLRSAFRVGYEQLVEGIAAIAREDCGLPLLRTYWYDASRDGLFTDQHKRIGMVDGVKVRLGRISYSGEQKGVDLRLALDLVGLARSGAVSVVYLVSGDDDLAEAVEEAQDLGVQVKLIGLRKPETRIGLASVAEHLALCVDGIAELPADLLESTFTRSVTTGPLPGPGVHSLHEVVAGAHTSTTADPASRARVAAGAGAASTGHPDTDPAGAPALSPAAPMPRPVPGPGPGPGPGPAHVPGTTGVLPRVPANHQGAREAPAASGHPEAGDSALLSAVGTVGASVADNWYANTTQRELIELQADRPLLPPEIDRVLLKDCAQQIGEWKTDIQVVRRALRAAFWDRLDQLT